MIEPTQDTRVGGQKFQEAFRWIRGATSENIAEEAAYAAVIYTDYVTAELQAKVDAFAYLGKNDEALIMELQARIATLEAELAAAQFAPITDEHKDGEPWQVGWYTPFGEWYSCYAFWDTYWMECQECRMLEPTHAAPMPKPPAKEMKS